MTSLSSPNSSISIWPLRAAACFCCLLCRSAADQEAAIQLVTRELGMPCMPLQIGSTRPVTQAVIPAASFPQNLFPASKSLPPALFPVLDADGILKPAILLLVEEAFEAGLQV